MSQSSEDGIDRESADYTAGRKEALEGVLQRLNTMMMGHTFQHPLTLGGLQKARNVVFELVRAEVQKAQTKQQQPAGPTPELPDQPKATTPTI